MKEKFTTTMLANQTLSHYESILVEVTEVKRRLGMIDDHLAELNNRVDQNVLEIERNKINKVYWFIFTLVSNIAVAAISYIVLR